MAVWQLKHIGVPLTWKHAPKIMRLVRKKSTIGRKRSSDFVLDSRELQGFISREHAVIIRKEGAQGQTFTLQDHSTNGTIINGFRVQGSQVLKPYDVIAFGHVNGLNVRKGQYAPQPKHEFVYQFERSEEPDAAEKLDSLSRNTDNVPLMGSNIMGHVVKPQEMTFHYSMCPIDVPDNSSEDADLPEVNKVSGSLPSCSEDDNSMDLAVYSIHEDHPARDFVEDEVQHQPRNAGCGQPVAQEDGSASVSQHRSSSPASRRRIGTDSLSGNMECTSRLQGMQLGNTCSGVDTDKENVQPCEKLGRSARTEQPRTSLGYGSDGPRQVCLGGDDGAGRRNSDEDDISRRLEDSISYNADSDSVRNAVNGEMTSSGDNTQDADSVGSIKDSQTVSSASNTQDSDSMWNSKDSQPASPGSYTQPSSEETSSQESESNTSFQSVAPNECDPVADSSSQSGESDQHVRLSPNENGGKGGHFPSHVHSHHLDSSFNGASRNARSRGRCYGRSRGRGLMRAQGRRRGRGRANPLPEQTEGRPGDRPMDGPEDAPTENGSKEGQREGSDMEPNKEPKEEPDKEPNEGQNDANKANDPTSSTLPQGSDDSESDPSKDLPMPLARRVVLGLRPAPEPRPLDVGPELPHVGRKRKGRGRSSCRGRGGPKRRRGRCASRGSYGTQRGSHTTAGPGEGLAFSFSQLPDLAEETLEHGVEWYEGDSCDLPNCLRPSANRLHWVQCDQCYKWYHTVCVGCSYEAVRDSGSKFHCGCTGWL